MEISSYSSLLEKFDKTKKELDEAGKTLRTLIGFHSNVYSKFSDPTKEESDNLSCKAVVKTDTVTDPKLKDTLLSEESSDDCEHLPKSSLQSTVAKVTSTRSRKDAIHKQNINPKVESRNRRILGMLQGTLRKFQDEAKKRKTQDLKRKQVEQKLEAAAEEEKERVKRQKLELISETTKKQQLLKSLEAMLNVTESYEIWEDNQKHLLNFIVTKAKPQIYFLPVSHTVESKKRLEKSKAEVLGYIHHRKMLVKEEIDKIKESYNLDDGNDKDDTTDVRNSTNEETFKNTISEFPDNAANITEEEKFSDICLTLQSDENEDDLFE